MQAWSDKKRIEVATAHCMGLNAPMIEVATGVPCQTIRHWRLQDWFKDLVEEMRREDENHTDAKLTKLVNKSLDVVVDRLENGDFMFDPKSQEFVRRPVAMKDAAKVSDMVFDKRNLLRGKPTTISAKQEQISDRLLKLAAEFSRFVNAKEIIADNKEITNGSVEITQGSVQGEISHADAVQGEVISAVHDEWTPGLQEGEPAVQQQAIGDTQASPA